MSTCSHVAAERQAVTVGGNIVCDNGAVISRLGRRLAVQISNAGYARVELHDRNVARKYSVHRLVAEAFVPNPEGKPHVNHIDGNKLNNAASNLEWTTQSENQLHAYRAGLQRGYRKPMPLSETHKQALCGSRWNYETHVYNLDGKTFTNLFDAAEHFGVSRQTILNRCKSERWPTWSKSKERR